MKKSTKKSAAAWVGCVVFGVTLMAAQWAAALNQPESSQAAGVELASLPGMEQELPVLDSRLIARLLVNSVVQIESAGNPQMVGRAGERGLMQIKADTWAEVTRKQLGVRIPFSRAFEPATNIRVGSAYLSNLQGFLSEHRHLWRADERSLLLACYNAGPERVRRAGFDLHRLPASTRDYVKRGSALHDALMNDHQVDAAAVRLAMASALPPRGG